MLTRCQTRAIGITLVSALVNCALLSNPLGATTIFRMDIEEVVRGAELIFEGKVVERNVRENAAGMILTYVTFRIDELIKGEFEEPFLELKFTGGRLGDQIMEVSGLRMPNPDEEGIYFVESVYRNLVNPLLGWSQGHYLIYEINGKRRVRTVSERPVTDILSIQSVPTVLRRPATLIDGNTDAATGVVAPSQALGLDQALSAESFKTKIRALMDD